PPTPTAAPTSSSANAPPTTPCSSPSTRPTPPAFFKPKPASTPCAGTATPSPRRAASRAACATATRAYPWSSYRTDPTPPWFASTSRSAASPPGRSSPSTTASACSAAAFTRARPKCRRGNAARARDAPDGLASNTPLGTRAATSKTRASAPHARGQIRRPGSDRGRDAGPVGEIVADHVDQRAAHHHAVRVFGHLGHVLALADAKAHHHRQLRVRLDAGHRLRHVGRHRVAHAGHAFARHIIDESRGRLRDRLQARLGRRRSHDEHHAHAVLRARRRHLVG